MEPTLEHYHILLARLMAGQLHCRLHSLGTRAWFVVVCVGVVGRVRLNTRWPASALSVRWWLIPISLPRITPHNKTHN